MAKKTGIRNTGVFIIVVFLMAGLSGADIEIDGLKSGTFERKIQIINSIVNTRNKVYLPELGAVIKNEENEEIRSKAALALLNIGDSTCLPLFQSAMKDSYWQVRYYAALGLGKYGNETVVSSLIGYLNDENEKVNEKILWSLLLLMRDDEAKAVFKKLSEDRIKPVIDKTKSLNPEMRIRSLWLLEYTGDRRAVPHFIRMLADENDEIKIRALWAIERFKSEEGGEEIEALLTEESTKLKVESIKTLVKLEMQEGISGLIKGLSDSDESVRIYSLWALEKFKNPVSYPSIAECLADSSEEVRDYAAVVIEKINDPLFLPVLQRFVDNERFSLDARLSALILLGEMGDSSVKQFILDKRGDSDALVRYTVIKSLSYLDSNSPDYLKFDADYLETVTYLEKNDVSPRVRNEASGLLDEIIGSMWVKLNSPERSERVFALQRIDPLIDAKGFPGLLLKMASSRYPEVREKMLKLVSEKPYRIFARSARDMMREPDVSMKKLAAIALGEIGDRESAPLLQKDLRHFDPEMQIICAWSLAKMGVRENVFPIAVRYIESDNPDYQRRAAETLGFLQDKRASSVLLKRMKDSELDVKLICAWALARIGEDKGMEMLVRLSEESIEPVRTSANVYLSDVSIPLSLRNKVPQIREKIHFEKLGIREVSPKVINAMKTTQIIEIDGLDRDRFWQAVKKENLFIEVSGDMVESDIQTKVATGYDETNIYLLFVCDDPDTSMLTLNSRDFITISINPMNSFKEWYQFVIHPLKHIRYSYIWKFYSNDEPERKWVSDWKVETKIETRRYVVELAIPLKDLKIEKVSQEDVWSINFQRESEHVPLTSWSGRIDNPEQFGILHFKE